MCIPATPRMYDFLPQHQYTTCMQKKPQHLSDETYLRIYRMMKRGVEAPRIASTLRLPLGVVREVVARFRRDAPTKKIRIPSSQQEGAAPQELYLHIHYEHRYPVLEMSGRATDAHIDEISQQLETLCETNYRAIAVSLDQVKHITPAVLELMKKYAKQCKQRQVYFALCGTSIEVEKVIQAQKFDEEVAVFGTRMAFEERAFRSPES